MLEAFEAK